MRFTDLKLQVMWTINLNITRLDDTSCEALNAELSPAEILDSIRSRQNGKIPGPGGFGVEFYNKYANQITPILYRMFSHSVKSERLPPTLYDANISLLLKQDRDETEPSSYRPISMINLDFKIFPKILANKLNKCIESITHTDQTGFIPNRFSFFNVRRIMDIMYYSFDKFSKQAILCLDVEKAFDQVEWRYFLRVLEEFGLRLLFSGCACCMPNLQHPFSLTWIGHLPFLCRGGRARVPPLATPVRIGNQTPGN